MLIRLFITDPRVVDRILRHRESERCKTRDPFEPRAPPRTRPSPLPLLARIEMLISLRPSRGRLGADRYPGPVDPDRSVRPGSMADLALGIVPVRALLVVGRLRGLAEPRDLDPQPGPMIRGQSVRLCLSLKR